MEKRKVQCPKCGWFYWEGDNHTCPSQPPLQDQKGQGKRTIGRQTIWQKPLGFVIILVAVSIIMLALGNVRHLSEPDRKQYTAEEPHPKAKSKPQSWRPKISRLSFQEADGYLSDRSGDLQVRPRGETSIHQEDFSKQQKRYLESIKGKWVAWSGELMDVSGDNGGTLRVRCNPKSLGSDTTVHLDGTQRYALRCLRKGNRVTFYARIADHSIFGWSLDSGKIAGY